MNKQDDILKKVLKNRLKDYESNPDSDMWSRIENSLNSRKKTKSIYWWKWAGAAAAIIFIFLICDRIVVPDRQEKMNYTEGTNSMKKINPGNFPLLLSPIQPSDQSPYGKMASVEDPVKPEKEIIRNPVRSEEKTSHKEINKNTDTPKDIIQNEFVAETPDKKEEPRNNTQNSDAIKKFEESANTEPKEWYASVDKANKESKNISFSLAMGNTGMISDYSGGLMGESDKSPIYSSIRNTYNSGEKYSDAGESLLSNFDEDRVQSIDYSLPLSGGLYVRKFFSNKFAIESGLTYTYLASKGVYTSAYRPVTNREIRLHYLGVPIKAVYSFVNNNRFSAYISGGGMVEKCVYGQEAISDAYKKSVNSLDIPELQWSVSGSIGCNYRLYRHLGIFIEPGVAYYFDDHSDVMTIRKDTPLNLEIRGGIRLTY